jgi:hypothetical protein
LARFGQIDVITFIGFFKRSVSETVLRVLKQRCRDGRAERNGITHAKNGYILAEQHPFEVVASFLVASHHAIGGEDISTISNHPSM